MHRLFLAALAALIATGCGSSGDENAESVPAADSRNDLSALRRRNSTPPADAAWSERNAQAEKKPLPDAASPAAGAPAQRSGTDGNVPVEAAEPRTLSKPLELADLIELVEPAVVRIDVETAGGRAHGSGFVVDDQGTIVTNFHVVEGARSARATFRDGTSLDLAGTLLLIPEKDIAVARVKPGGGQRPATSVLRLATAPPRKGEAVMAFGAPEGLSFTASQGIVSALRTSAELEDQVGERTRLKDAALIQTDAAISPGSSGGPLVNRAGEVVGITTLTHRIGQNLNFAVSSAHIREAIGDAAGRPLVALSPAAVPTAPGPRLVNSFALRAAIETALVRERQQFAADIERRRGELAQLETELQTLQHLTAVVRDGGKEAFDVIRNSPFGESRSAWLKHARDQADALTSRIAEDRAELDRDADLAEQGMFPPPRLESSPSPGDFGFVHSHVRVTRALEDGTFLARFGQSELHWQGFDAAAREPGELVLVAAMCIATGPYTSTTSLGASETTVSIEPLGEDLIPDWYRESLNKRIELQTARLKSRLDAWEQRIARAESAVDAGGPLPRLGTRFEPATLIEIITGGRTLKAPNLPRRYRSESVTVRQPRFLPNGRITTVEVGTVRRVETEESKRWRAQQLAEFNARRAIYPAFSLIDFIGELQEWATDSELLYNHRGELQQDIDKLVNLAFTGYGLSTPEPRDVPWSSETKQQLIAHLKQMAIRYGNLDEAVLLAVEDGAAEANGRDDHAAPDDAEAARREATAAAKLEFAQRFIVADRPRRGKEAEARKWLEVVVKEFPGTRAAAEAQELLHRFGFD
jgi:S1-C subfamily serine protease